MTDAGDEPLILSALNDYLYCPRRCALHRVEGLWSDNAFTLSGDIAHETADDPGYRECVDALGTVLRIERALPLFSRRLNLVGKSDIVEFHGVQSTEGKVQSAECKVQSTESKVQSAECKVQSTGFKVRSAECRAAKDALHYALGTLNFVPLPVDYKLGKRRKWDNDDVQLCAQGMCLEEMLGVGVPAGAVYHVATRRRREVPFTPELRLATLRTIEEVRDLLAEGRVPAAELRPQCEGCSMHSICLPELTQRPGALNRAHGWLFTDDPPQPNPLPNPFKD